MTFTITPLSLLPLSKKQGYIITGCTYVGNVLQVLMLRSEEPNFVIDLWVFLALNAVLSPLLLRLRCLLGNSDLSSSLAPSSTTESARSDNGLEVYLLFWIISQKEIKMNIECGIFCL